MNSFACAQFPETHLPDLLLHAVPIQSLRLRSNAALELCLTRPVSIAARHLTPNATAGCMQAVRCYQDRTLPECYRAGNAYALFPFLVPHPLVQFSGSGFAPG